jgi:hypothetical protein
MPPRFDMGAQVKTEKVATQILLGASHSDKDGWRAQLMMAFGTSSEIVAKEKWNTSLTRSARGVARSILSC